MGLFCYHQQQQYGRRTDVYFDLSSFFSTYIYVIYSFILLVALFEFLVCFSHGQKVFLYITVPLFWLSSRNSSCEDEALAVEGGKS